MFGQWSLWRSLVLSLNRSAGGTLASWYRIRRTRTTLRVGQPGRAGRTTAQSPPSPRGVGAREGACLARGLMHPACLPRLSRSPRWGRPKLSTTSTTRRHHIWWNCQCRRTKSLWQTSKMSSRSRTTNSSSNLWTMTSGNCFGALLYLTWNQCNSRGISEYKRS